MAIIYKISNTVNDKFYIGSTVEKWLCKRWGKHRGYKKHPRYLKNNKNLLWKCFDEIGIENFKCEIIETCEKSVVREREQYYINLLQPQLNLNKAFGCDIENKRQLIREHYKNNKKYYQDFGKKKITCECGLEVSYWSLYHHKKTKLHTTLMAKLPQKS